MSRLGGELLLSVLFLASVVFAQAQAGRQPDFTISGEAAKSVAAIACNPDGRSIAVAESDNGVRVYDMRAKGGLKARPLRKLIGHKAPILAVSFLNSNTLVSVSIDQTVKTWDVASGKLLHSTAMNLGKQLIPALAPAGQPWLVGASSNHIRLCNYESGELLKSFDVNDSDVSTLVFTPDGKQVVIGTTKGVIRVMDVAAWKVSRIIDMDSPVHSLAASSKQIAVGYADGTLDMLSLGEETSVPEITAHDRAVTAVAFSPKGERLASGSADGAVKVWDSRTLKLFGNLKGPSVKVLSIMFSPDGQQLISVGADGEVHCWSIR